MKFNNTDLLPPSTVAGAEDDESSSVAEFLEGQCVSVCPNNVTDFIESSGIATSIGSEDSNIQDESADIDDVVTLKVMVGGMGRFTAPLVEAFNAARKDVRVEYVVTSMADLAPDIINEAKSRTGLYDGFVTPPGVMGSIVDDQGWLDLRDYIDLEDWNDIKLGYRKWIAQYEGQILMYPVDGDLLNLFYNKEIFEHFNVKVPRTWEEYNQVAETIHGQVYKNKTLVGSCVGRVKGCAGAYWANLMLSSLTQTRGPSQGHIFDTQDMSALLGGGVLETMLELMEGQVKFGHPEEFDKCVGLNQASLRDGECAMHYNWGNTFTTHLLGGASSSLKDGKLGVAMTPGSTRVLDRDTNELVQCNEDTCPFGTYYEDIGWVNHAPYLAFGGWSCAVSNYTTSFKKQATADFCAFMASKKESTSLVVPQDATAEELKTGGADPFRSSHLDPDLYVAGGYGQEATLEYLKSIQEGLDSENVVTDIRFPGAAAIYGSLDVAVHDHLNATRFGEVIDIESARKDMKSILEKEWTELIANRDAETSTRVSTFESYQRLRGVYTVDVNQNQLNGGIRAYGFALAALTLLASVGFGVWTLVNRKNKVVRASQPFFLILICAGIGIFGSSIIPMSIDDGIASEDACSKACMAIPWLALMGWTILFAALYAKLRRVNLVMKNAANFKRLRVSEREVMTPFVVLFTANLVLLLTWTFTDPLYWERRVISETESYGTCAADNDSVAWKVCLGLLGVVNGAALILANVEAYKGRKVSTEYGESTYIGLAMGSMLQVFLVGMPLFFLVRENPTASFFVNSSMAFIVSMSVLMLLFVPKLITWFNPPPSGSMTNGRASGRRRSSVELIRSSARENDNMLWAKIQNLKDLLQESGVDAASVFEKVGLNENKNSTTSGFGSSILSNDLSSSNLSLGPSDCTLHSIAEKAED